MKVSLANRILALSESETLAMAKRARALKAEGYDVISLSTGEPDFQTPDHIKIAAKKAIDDGHSFYTPVSGIPELKAAIVNKLQRDNQLTYQNDQIVVSTGAKHSIMNVILSLVNPGDEVIIPTPYWVSYSEMVRYAGGIPILVTGPFEQSFKITPEQLETHITSKTKLFLFSSPCNPTGAFYSKQDLKELVNVFMKHPQVYICSDEIYEHINFSGKHVSIATFSEVYERTILVNGVSKGFAMTGWRIGYIAAHKDIAAACEKLQGQFTSGTNSIAQWASVAALGDNLSPTQMMCERFKARRDLVLELSKEIPGFKTFVPDGAFYLFPDVTAYFSKSFQDSKINNAEDLSMYLLNKAHVAVVHGSAFGSPECIRISFATSEDLLKEAFNRMKIALANLT
jgi:aspartate aminotransferase